jgi:hypothetical protein
MSGVAAIAAAVAAVPATAAARWSPAVALPQGAQSATSAVGAIDDAGRAALALTVDGAPRMAMLTPAAGLTATVPAGAAPRLLRFAPDGTVVGAGTAPTGERPEGPDVHDHACCLQPFVLRWRPGDAAAAITPVVPATGGSYDVVALAVDRAGTAFVAAVQQPGALQEGTFAARAPVGGVPVQHALPAITNQLVFAPAPRASGAVLGWPEPRGERRLTLGGTGTPLVRGRPEALPGAGHADEQLTLAGTGRAIRAFRARDRLWVAVDGGRPRVVAPLVGGRWAMDAGADGTVAFAFSAGDRLGLRTLDPRGRLRAPVDLGPWSGSSGPVVAVDGHGGTHVAWSTQPTTILVRGPRGRHTIVTQQDAALRQLAVSPRGAALLLYADGDLPFAAVATA